MDGARARNRWDEIKIKAHQYWGRVAEEELAGVAGHLGHLVDLIQEHYGYSREQAEREVEHFLKTYGSPLQGTAQQVLGDVEHTAMRYPQKAVLGAFLLGFLIGLIARPKR